MTDSYTDIDDGVGRYASRTRVNRKILTLTGDGTNSLNGTLNINGKISRIVLDPSRVSCGSNTATGGSLKITMDIEDTGGTEYPYCDTVAALDVRTASNTPLNFQTAEGGNMNADGGTTSGLHFTVTAPASSTTGGKTIDEPAPWNGLVCGQVRFTIATSNSTFASGDIRLIVIYE
tara:strand:- start:6117 stop:6644 length:528 start_codon:yes stop_codon:yes gene_type:complete